MNLKLGDTVEYGGRLWVVRGFTHASSSEQHVVLEDSAASTPVVTLPVRALVEPDNKDSDPSARPGVTRQP